MDPLDPLRCVLALAVYPGGLFLAVAGGLTAAIAGLRGLGRTRRDEAAAVLLCCIAAALLPLPGTPLDGLPAGVAMVAVLMLVAAALAWGGPRQWSQARLVAAVAAALPVLSLAAPATTLEVATLASLPGRVVTAARILAAIALVLAAPVLAGGRSARVSPVSRAAVLATLLLLGVSLVVAVPGAGVAAPVAGAAALIAVAAVTGLLRVTRAQVALGDAVLAGAASVCALGAVICAALG